MTSITEINIDLNVLQFRINIEATLCQKELFWLVFFVWYLAEYLIKWAYYRNSYTAYRNISFEREAYAFENDLDYLSRRRFFAFFRFVRR